MSSADHQGLGRGCSLFSSPTKGVTTAAHRSVCMWQHPASEGRRSQLRAQHLHIGTTCIKTNTECMVLYKSGMRYDQLLLCLRPRDVFLPPPHPLEPC